MTRLIRSVTSLVLCAPLLLLLLLACCPAISLAGEPGPDLQATIAAMNADFKALKNQDAPAKFVKVLAKYAEPVLYKKAMKGMSAADKGFLANLIAASLEEECLRKKPSRLTSDRAEFGGTVFVKSHSNGNWYLELKK